MDLFSKNKGREDKCKTVSPFATHNSLFSTGFDVHKKKCAIRKKRKKRRNQNQKGLETRCLPEEWGIHSDGKGYREKKGTSLGPGSVSTVREDPGQCKG